MRVMYTLLAACLLTPTQTAAQEYTLQFSLRPYIGCYSLPALYTIIHAWQYYGRDVASAAWHFQSAEGDCPAELKLTASSPGVAISPPLLLTNHEGWTTVSYVRQLTLGPRTPFYIDQRQ